MKVDGSSTLDANEWNTHVTDQKTRAVRGMTLVATAIVFADATEQLLTEATALLSWDNTNKRLGIGTASPASKLDILDGNLYLSDSDVAHGRTTLIPTIVYGALKPLSATTGGLEILGLSDTDSKAIRLTGVIGSQNPTDTTAAVSILAYKQDAGTDVAAIGAAETAFGVDSNADGTMEFYVLGNGNSWFVGDVSAQSFTDRTPFYSGNALIELKAVTGIDGEIDHASLPAFAKNENGRDLGAMVSILTKAVQQLTARIEQLELNLRPPIILEELPSGI